MNIHKNRDYFGMMLRCGKKDGKIDECKTVKQKKEKRTDKLLEV